MRSVTAYATPGPWAPFEKTTIERRDLRPNDVLIKIAYAGICHSDIHQARGEWGPGMYPLVPGHEIAGTVEEVGADVRRFSAGDRVGVGVLVDSCRTCDPCRAGEEQHCINGVTETYGTILPDGQQTQGGYSTHIVVDADFVVTIPDSMGLDVAAPLLCAGITLYSPLRHWGAGPGKRVAIIGLGGLGHVGVKIAHAMGAEVSVLSQTLAKEADGRRMGAAGYYATSDPATFEQLRGRFDLIICTVSVPLPIDDYLELVRLDGALVMVGLPPEALSVHAGTLMTNRRSFAGSGIGGIRETQEMLDFCAEHGIAAEIEVIGGEEIDAAWDRVVASDVRYRFVIDIATL
jgi:alcohol dehydrogenase (NADP+)